MAEVQERVQEAELAEAELMEAMEVTVEQHIQEVSLTEAHSNLILPEAAVEPVALLYLEVQEEES